MTREEFTKNSMYKDRIPENPEEFIDWITDNFAYGGLENYTEEQVEAYMKALASLIKYCDRVEFYYLGKVLIQLSNRSYDYLDRLYEMFDELGYGDK